MSRPQPCRPAPTRPVTTAGLIKLKKAVGRLGEGLEALSERLERRMYPAGRPNRVGKALNRAWALVGRAGLWPSRLVTLEVRGRRSGRMILSPLVVADVDGERYLVAMLGGGARWVENVRAQNGRVTLRHGRRESVRLEELDPGERPRILRRYVEVAPGGRAMIGVQPDASQAEFERIAPHYPVFRITPDPAASEVRTTPRLWIFNRLVNPVIRALLRSRFHVRLGRTVALLTYRGTLSGREITIPVQYVRDPSGRYVIVPGDPDHKRWWRNFQVPVPVRLLVAGEEIAGIGELAGSEAERAMLLSAYAESFPASVRAMRLRKNPGGKFTPEALANAARTTAIVVVKPTHRSGDAAEPSGEATPSKPQLPRAQG